MGVQRILAIVGNRLAEYVGLQASAGAASAGQIMALNPSGLLDPTMLPAIDIGEDAPPTPGLFASAPTPGVTIDLGLAGDPYTVVSDLGLAGSPAGTTIDLGIAGT